MLEARTMVNALSIPAKNMISAVMKISIPITPLGSTGARRTYRGGWEGIVPSI